MFDEEIVKKNSLKKNFGSKKIVNPRQSPRQSP